jgi:hypothetical protein
MHQTNDREESQTITETYAPGPKRLKFIVQSIIAVIIISFSVTQIMLNTTRESTCDSPDNTVWIGLICTILGLFFPQPTPTDAIPVTINGSQSAPAPVTDDQSHEKITRSTHIRSRPATPVPKFREIMHHNSKKIDKKSSPL